MSTMQDIIDTILETRQKCDTTLFIGLLAESYIKENMLENAAISIDQALEIAKQTNEQYYLPMLLRTKAILSENEKFTDQARNLALQQQSKLWISKLQ